MARPRVLLVITLAETGGAQTYVASLVPALLEEFDVAVAAHGHGFLRDAVLEAGARYVPLTHVRRSLDPRHDVLGLMELMRLFRRERPQIVHANSSKAGILGRLAATATGVPVRLFTVHGWAFKAHAGRTATAYLWADRLMRPLTSTIICVAESERRTGLEARTCQAERTVVIYNGVPLDRPRRRPAPGPLRLLRVGRLRAPKDFITLVRAVAALPAGSARLRIAGDGPDRGALEEELARLGTAGTVELLGTRHDVDELLADSDVFVLSSDSEGFPMSVVEAMAAGVAVVAGAVGGVPEAVVDGETGLLVPPRDIAALAGALDALAGDPARVAAMGEAGRRRAEERFDIAAFQRAHVELYRGVLRGRRWRRRRTAAG
jgi:glycosyltransferase involved in cell wall biosynthesis